MSTVLNNSSTEEATKYLLWLSLKSGYILLWHWVATTDSWLALQIIIILQPVAGTVVQWHTTVPAAIVHVADVPSRQRLVLYFRRPPDRSGYPTDLHQSCTFPVAGARIWYTLPLHVTSASSLTVFKQRLKLHLFCFSFPGLSPVWLLSGPCSVCCHLGHYKKFDWLIE